MSSQNDYDVIIIGTGAGGGTLAYRLAPSGKRILLLERGDYVPREKDNWDTRAVVTEGKYHIKEAWYDKDGNEFHAGTHYFVGGNTKFYGAALVRLRKQDFGEIRHHGGVSPAWPIGYEDLEPYYTQAEHLYQVHGKRGIDPTDPPASAPYLYPAVSHEPRIQQLSDDLEKLGYHPFLLPMGVMLDEKNPRKSRCIRCATCDGHPCLVNAKADAQVVCVDPALEHPNVTLITNAFVSRLETSASGREVSKVYVERNGARETYSAGVVVVSAGAINSAALLLRSANDKHPNGLANSSDQVGRKKVSNVEVWGEPYERLQGIFGVRMRVVRLKLGDEYIELTEYLAPKGRPIPIDMRSNDRWFQHFAIIVTDMAKAYARLRSNKIEHASTGPQRLPDWNKNAGGIEAFYFRDPDGHHLEVLAFPPDKGLPKWHGSKEKLFLGIDHTAIVVGDTEASLRFYRDFLGMRVAGESENFGTEQEHLNNVFGARLRITAVRAATGPGIEFLEYKTPRDGRPYPPDARANDLIHWQTRLVSRAPDTALEGLFAIRAHFISPGLVTLVENTLGFKKGFLLRDPDGHAVQIVEK